MEHKRLHIWEKAALLALSLTLLWGAWAQERQASIAAGVLRLHVIAVNDSGEEQALKLRVRDAVLEELRPLLQNAADAAEAGAIAEENLPSVAAAAEAVSEGRTVTVSLGRERYPLREYGAFRLPAGEYRSLRVILGEGRGRNWWCVIFPTLCLEAAEAPELRESLGEENFALVTGRDGYALAFWLLERWGELQALLA